MTKRRKFTPEFKAQVVLEELTGLKTKAEVCREYRLKAEGCARRRAEFLNRAPEIFATRPSRGEEQARIAELERMIGRLAMALAVAKKPRSSGTLSRAEAGGDRDAGPDVPDRGGLQGVGLCSEQLLPPVGGIGSGGSPQGSDWAAG